MRFRPGCGTVAVLGLAGMAPCWVTAPVLAQPQVPTAWQLLDDGDPVRSFASPLAYDATRRRVVLLHSGMPRVYNEAPVMHWELVGEDWVRRMLPEPTPHTPEGSCVTWDGARSRMIVFGSALTPYDQTWEFDGTSWSRRVTPTTPPARYDCMLAYDEAQQRTVMFGGFDPATAEGLSDTWEYDGTNWTLVVPSTIPPARGEAGMSYDADRDRTVLVAGRNGSLLRGDIWEYDGRRKRWTQRTPATGPIARSGPGMAYDRVRKRTVLFGGSGYAGDLADTWEWNGQIWTQRSPSGAPSARRAFHMVWDIERQKVLGHGGGPSNGDFNDTWTWDGTIWTHIAVSGRPEVRSAFAMAYDSDTDSVVLYGGRTAYPPLYLWDTWEWNGGRWRLVEGAGAPTASYYLSFAWDEAGGRLLAFSGADGTPTPEIRDIHTYDAEAAGWSSTPTCCPDPRSEYGWANAPVLGGTMMYGGLACCVVGDLYIAEDTWRFDGSGWTQLFPPHTPGPRYFHAMSHDEARGRLILYGGEQIRFGSGPMADTWVFDGQDWARVCDMCGPGGRRRASLVYDRAREVTVLFGFGSVGEGVTWEFDGAAWIARPTLFQPEPSRCDSQLAYDSKREIVVLFGGTDCLGGGTHRNDTWAYGADPDEDGIVGKLDNCVEFANPDQANMDGDPAGDACDCAIADGGSFAPPLGVSGLTVAGSASATVSWDDQAPAIGTGARYDVTSGGLNELRSVGFGGAVCLAASVATTSAQDDRVPMAGDGYWYLARSRNACGLGSYGAGRAPLDAASPCP